MRKQLLVASVVLLVSLAIGISLGGSASAKNKHKPTLHDTTCAHVATATDTVGFAIIQLDSSGNLQIEVAVKHGMPRLEYKAYLVQDSCAVLFTDDILTTNKKGKGNIHIMVPHASIPAGAKVAVELVSPPGAMLPAGPFVDVITSDIVTPSQMDEAEEEGRL